MVVKVRLGVVEGIVRTGHVVVRLEGGKPPRLGVTVTKDGQAVGRLVDVIGPVDRPWGVVRLRSGSSVEPGEVLYYIAPRRSDRRERPRSRGSRPRGKRAPRSKHGGVHKHRGDKGRNKGMQRHGRGSRRRGNRLRG